jgi:hypothetical protein
MPLRENASTTRTLPSCGSATLDGPEVVTIDPFRSMTSPPKANLVRPRNRVGEHPLIGMTMHTAKLLMIGITH